MPAGPDSPYCLDTIPSSKIYPLRFRKSGPVGISVAVARHEDTTFDDISGVKLSIPLEPDIAPVKDERDLYGSRYRFRLLDTRYASSGRESSSTTSIREILHAGIMLG